MMMRTLIVVLAVGLPLHAHADDPKFAAKQHVDRASELHKDGKFKEALAELKTAYALDPRPQLLFAMGQLHVSLGECTQAITYYERFLTTKPSSELASLVNEAITACKTNPPAAVDAIQKPELEVVPPAPSARPAPPPRAQPRREPTTLAVRPTHTPWYRNYLADGLVLGGLVAGGLGIYMFDRARSDRDAADAATSYGAYTQLIDRAHDNRTYAVVLGVLGGAAVTVGGLRFLLARPAEAGVAVTPTRGGGTVTWTGRF